MNNGRLPRLALTVGDVSGIGPEISVRVASNPAFRELCSFVLYGPETVILDAAQRFAPGFCADIRPVGDLDPGRFEIGKPQAACERAAYDAVVTATRDALDGSVDAIVTAPVNKYAVTLSGIEFTGHTELVAELCGVKDFAMMQSDGDFRVAFVTTHIALAEVPVSVTRERIEKVARLLYDVCVAEGVKEVRLACAAVNPHAGENGCMGKEEETVVNPALAALRAQGIKIDGPFPPDTLFIESTRKQYHGIVSMYHDQGHIPFKMIAFDRGVNSTLGLPIIRTSVDHGTAFEIAWQGIADCGSLIQAVKVAAKRAMARRNGEQE